MMFAKSLGFIVDIARFKAIDGVHQASISQNLVQLEMLSVSEITMKDQDYIINTGSPHYIRFIDDISDFDIVDFGKSIRYAQAYEEEGINVNLLAVEDGENRPDMDTALKIGVVDQLMGGGVVHGHGSASLEIEISIMLGRADAGDVVGKKGAEGGA